MSGGNTVRGEMVDIEQEFRLLERLPDAVRRALRNALFDFAVGDFLASYRKGDSIETIVDDIIQSDMEIAREEAAFVWQGEASAYLAAQPPRKRRDWTDDLTKRASAIHRPGRKAASPTGRRA